MLAQRRRRLGHGWRKRDLGRKNLFILPNITNQSSRSSSQLLSSCAFLMTSKCLLNLDMSAALRLLSVCLFLPFFSHHTDTAIAGFFVFEDRSALPLYPQGGLVSPISPILPIHLAHQPKHHLVRYRKHISRHDCLPPPPSSWRLISFLSPDTPPATSTTRFPYISIA